MDSEKLIEIWKSEERRPFTGWDFSYLDGRMLEDQAPWSYSNRASELMRHASSVIDMDTGGGERFLKMREYWPQKVVATEEYPPNYKLVTERLKPLGVEVFDVRLTEEGPMPFNDNEFDLVLNRHAAFNSAEVTRILAPGGTFLTQQVHGQWAYDLRLVFNAKALWPDASLERYVPRLKAAGLKIIDTRDFTGKLEFTDVGAIVYYLKAVPWMVPGFSVATHLEHLFDLQRRLESGAGLVFTLRKYLIEARKS